MIDIVVPSKILSKISTTKKVAYRSEMARNAIESHFRTSKMAAGKRKFDLKLPENLKKLIKFRMDLKLPEMPSKVNFGHPKWPINLKWPEM